MIGAFLYGAVLALAVGFPADWARRKGSAGLREAATLLNVVGIVVGIALAASLTFGGFFAALALVFGTIAGSMIGNRLAERRYGPAR